MRKGIIVFCLLLLLCSCGNTKKPKKVENCSSGVVVTLPQDDSVNGYRQNRSAQTVNSEVYYANMTSMKFHKSECTYAKRLRSEKCWITNDREALLSEGYQPCGACDP